MKKKGSQYFSCNWHIGKDGHITGVICVPESLGSVFKSYTRHIPRSLPRTVTYDAFKLAFIYVKEVQTVYLLQSDNVN
jgi:hypothetical protein